MRLFYISLTTKFEMNTVLRVSEEGSEIAERDWTVNKAAICGIRVVTTTVIAWPRCRFASGKERGLLERECARLSLRKFQKKSTEHFIVVKISLC